MKKIVLLGNPNTGKSSIFNLLTGQKQPVGNFAGVTVDKKIGKLKLDGEETEITDLPGTYSIYPNSVDEDIVFKELNNSDKKPDLIVYVADSTNLAHNLLLFTQVHDLGIPILLLVNMSDKLKSKGLKIDYNLFEVLLPDVKILPCNARLKSDIPEIKKSISKSLEAKCPKKLFLSNPFELKDIKELREKDTIDRLTFIEQLVKKVLHYPKEEKIRFSKKIDRFLIHPVFGYLFLLGVLFFIFQMIFSFSEIPMDLIDGVFGELSLFVHEQLPSGLINDLISEGIIPGIGGIVIFIPQIALLFLFIGIMEETGYMSRVVFILDRLMRPLGLSGKSIVPLMGSVACAIPGIMSTRTISGWKNRMITILVAPFMSCSARIPVYTILIALVIPDKELFGIINLKGLTLLALYLLGTFTALLGAFILKFVLKSKEKDFLILELPSYSFPNIKNTLNLVFFKTRDFVWGAGKIILTISIILWVLASFKPYDIPDVELSKIENEYTGNQITKIAYENKLAALNLQYSYIGRFGNKIQPLIAPLGYDWKIGIALATSFAAREVFVGTLATLYSVGSSMDESSTLLSKMREDINPQTNQLTYNLATGMSLMIFYVFAMQCMATLAIVKKETNSWKWALYQLIAMGVLAYVGAFITYQILS